MSIIPASGAPAGDSILRKLSQQGAMNGKVLIIKNGRLGLTHENIESRFYRLKTADTQFQKLTEIAKQVQKLIENDVQLVYANGNVEGYGYDLNQIRTNLEIAKRKLIGRAHNIETNRCDFSKVVEGFTSSLKSNDVEYFEGELPTYTKEQKRFSSTLNKVAHCFIIADSKLEAFTTPIYLQALSDSTIGSFFGTFFHLAKKDYSYINTIVKKLDTIEKALKKEPQNKILLTQKQQLEAILGANDNGIDALQKVGHAILQDLFRHVKGKGYENPTKRTISLILQKNLSMNDRITALLTYRDLLKATHDTEAINSLDNLVLVFRLISLKDPKKKIDLTKAGINQSASDDNFDALLQGEVRPETGAAMLRSRAASMIRVPDKAVGANTGRALRLLAIGLLESGNVGTALGSTTSAVAYAASFLPLGLQFVPTVAKYALYAFIIEPNLVTGIPGAIKDFFSGDKLEEVTNDSHYQPLPTAKQVQNEHYQQMPQKSKRVRLEDTPLFQN